MRCTVTVSQIATCPYPTTQSVYLGQTGNKHNLSVPEKPTVYTNLIEALSSIRNFAFSSPLQSFNIMKDLDLQTNVSVSIAFI